MKVTILGSAGQIGAYLTEYLREKGHVVVEFDVANGDWQDMTRIPNVNLHDALSDTDFCFFLAFDVGGSRYLKSINTPLSSLTTTHASWPMRFTISNDTMLPFVFASSQMSNMSYSPYGVMKRVGELYTKSLNALTVKFWNVYGIEKDMEKAHVITDFIRKGFEEGDFEMLTDGTEERQFLYAEDCCEALETVMLNYKDFKPNDELHITSFNATPIKDVASIIMGQFNMIDRPVRISPGLAKDSVQLDKRNEADNYIMSWWLPKTSIQEGIAKVFNEMKKEYLG